MCHRGFYRTRDGTFTVTPQRHAGMASRSTAAHGAAGGYLIGAAGMSAGQGAEKTVPRAAGAMRRQTRYCHLSMCGGYEYAQRGRGLRAGGVIARRSRCGAVRHLGHKRPFVPRNGLDDRVPVSRAAVPIFRWQQARARRGN